MKKLLLSLTALTLASTAFADIQDPPMNDQGPTRKLSRGISNVLFGITELPQCINQINDREGNAAAASYGVVRGVTRTAVRIGAGVYEIVTFPFPTNRSSYRPALKSNIPWIHGGYEEFPPELGWNTRKRYNSIKYGF
jgi:putative exosortase-associated protein (TIGR04073 family)